MSYLLGTCRALATTLANALQKPTTVEFPFERRTRAERYRAGFALLHDEHGDELCIGCLACERICPSRVIQVKQAPKRESKVTGKKRGYAEDFTIDLTGCMGCELCVQVCPTDALVMTREPETPSFCREDLVVTMDRLYANEKNKPAAWANGTKLMAMQEPAGQAKGPQEAKEASPKEAS
ncbi:MAG: 4Fe-4S dicluster domain-containing protein [Deltaproteobacteria bacterium]|nr:4Fe-4S dicluster domain-containing protein [Deltaproteobacteria bacterium]